jgi:hypothetical protein
MSGSHAVILYLVIIISCLGCKKDKGIPNVKATSGSDPAQNTRPIEGENTRPVTNGSAAKVLVKKGLELVDSPGAVATFGWGAAAAGVRQLSADASEETASLRDLVEARGLRQESVPAFRSVMFVYQTDSARRASRLSEPATGDDAFLLAAIAELLFGKDHKLPQAGIPPGSQLRRDTLDVLRMRSGEVPEPGLLDRIEQRLTQPELENVLPLALAADCEQVRGPRWGASDGRFRVLERLWRFAGVDAKTARETVLVTTAREGASRLQSVLDQEPTMRSILQGYEVKGERVDQPVGDRTVTVTPEPFTLEADYHPQPYTSDSESLWGQVVWHSQIASTSLEKISEFDKPGLLLNGRPQIADKSWLCALNPDKKLPDWYVGCTFGKIQRAGLQDVGTAGVGAYAFGMEHRIWLPVLDPNRGAVKWGSGRPIFKLRCGFTPSPECLFVAVRWKGAGNPPISYTSGVLDVVGIPANKNPVEQETNWVVLCVEPNVQLEVEIRHEAKIQEQTTKTWNIGYNAASTIEDYLEILPIDATNIDAFKFVNIQIAADPLTISAPSQSGNGLLAYAALLTKAAANPKWPAPLGRDAGSTAAAALVQLQILMTLSRADLQQVPGFGAETAQNPWRVRQALLQRAMPLLCERVWRKVERPLILQVAVLGQPLERTSRARAKVTQALAALAQLTVDFGNELLQVSAAELKQGDPAVINDLELLKAALVGAEEELAVLERELASRRALCCHVLKSLQHPGFPLDNPKHLPMMSDADALDLCAEK